MGVLCTTLGDLAADIEEVADQRQMAMGGLQASEESDELWSLFVEARGIDKGMKDGGVEMREIKAAMVFLHVLAKVDQVVGVDGA